MRDMESNLMIAQTNFNRRVAAQREVEAVQAAYEAGRITLDVLLEAQRTLADAQSDYYRVLVNYNEAIAQVHYRKGSLLEYNGVYLAEGPWPGKAYFDARRRARARDAAHYLNYGFTLPRAISRGPVNQWADSAAHGGSARTAGRRRSPREVEPGGRARARTDARRRRRRPMPAAAANADQRPTPMNLSRIHRLLKLISLLQAGRGYNIEGLAGACGVSRRTIFRDLDLLRQSGVPLSLDDQQSSSTAFPAPITSRPPTSPPRRPWR